MNFSSEIFIYEFNAPSSYPESPTTATIPAPIDKGLTTFGLASKAIGRAAESQLPKIAAMGAKALPIVRGAAGVAGPVGTTIAAGTIGGEALSYAGDKALKYNAARQVKQNASGTNSVVMRQLQNPNAKFNTQSLNALRQSTQPTQFSNPSDYSKMQNLISQRQQQLPPQTLTQPK